MSITEHYSEKEEKEFGCGTTFMVRDAMLVFDRRLAHAINHLYNHIRTLIHLASVDASCAHTEFEFLAANHPHLREQVLELQGHLSEPSLDFKKVEVLRSTVIRRLVEETQTLTEISASLAQAIEHERQYPGSEDKGDEGNTTVRLEQALARIPFIDYHAIVEANPSIVRVVNV